MSSEYEEPGHGNSPAAWTAVIVMLAAVAGGTLAFCFFLPWLVWIFVGVFVIGAILGWVLKRAGYGAGGSRVLQKEH